MPDETLADFFGEPISSYTSDDALEDGQLVEPFPDKFPKFFLTDGVFRAIERIEQGTFEQKAIPLMVDAAMIVRAKPDDYIWTKGLEGNVTNVTVWIGRNEKGGLTLMLPEEN